MNKRFPLLLGLLFFCAVQVYASGIDFVEKKTWKEILALAKKKNKLIFLDAYTTWCGPCKYLQQNVFTDGGVADFFNENFINVQLDMEQGEGKNLSTHYNIRSYPTLLFIDGNGLIVHKAIGAMEAGDFLDLGYDAIDPERQFFTLKKQISTGTVHPETLHEWIHTAENLEEPGIQEVLKRYLAATRYSLVEKEMLTIILDHARQLTKTQFDLIFKNRAKLSKTAGITPEEMDASLMTKLANYAVDHSLVKGMMDFSKFRKAIEVYYPKKGLLETQKMKVTYYRNRNQHQKCLAELNLLLTKPEFGISVQEMASCAIENTNLIVEQKKGKEFVQKISAFAAKPADKSRLYYKDLALMVLYYRMDDEKNTKEFSARILKNTAAPESVKDLARKVLQ